MVALVTLWQLSLLLCALGTIALLVLILARGLSSRGTKRRNLARRQLVPLLIGDAAGTSPVRGVEAKVAMELTIELAELMRGEDRDAMLSVAEKLDVPRHLARRLKSRSAQERLTAAETLALFDGHAHIAEGALDDRNPDVRLGAALALAHRDGGPRPIEIVRKLSLGVDEHSLLLVSLMRDFAARDPGAVEAMLFDGTLPDEAKLAAIEALAELGHRHIKTITYLAQESYGEPHLQPRIFAALGRTRHPGGIDAVRVALGSPLWQVRAAAAQAAGRSSLIELDGQLGTLLDDHAWPVRFRAAEALLKLGAKGRDELLRVADGSKGKASDAARTMLAECGAA